MARSPEPRYGRQRRSRSPEPRRRRHDDDGEREREAERRRGGRHDERDDRRERGDGQRESDRRRERDSPPPDRSRPGHRRSVSPDRDRRPKREPSPPPRSRRSPVRIPKRESPSDDRKYGVPPAFPPHGSRSPSPPPNEDKAKPNFNASGALAAATNTFNGVVLKYNEPPEARKPAQNWRLYVFKGSEQVDLLHISRQSAYLIGRDRVVADLPIEHPSCSKQHAVIQYRQITTRNEFGETSTSVKPFIIDLDSTNGTFVNDEDIPKSRYYELKQSDVIKFGQSTREYVLLHEDA